MSRFLIIDTSFIRTGPGLGAGVTRTVNAGTVLEIDFCRHDLKDGYVWIPLIGEGEEWTAESNGVYLPDEMDDFVRSMIFIIKWEGGYVNDPNDPGGETKFGISKRAFPHLDILSLTFDQALEIYRREYWIRSGANSMSWPINLVHFNFCVNAGIGAADHVFVNDINEYLEKQEGYYRSLHLFSLYGDAWIRRLTDLKEYIQDGMHKS